MTHNKVEWSDYSITQLIWPSVAFRTDLQAKISAIRAVQSARKSVGLVMVKCFGVHTNSYYHDFVQQDINLTALFSQLNT